MKILQAIAGLVVVLLVGVSIFNQYSTTKANKLVDEGNATINAYNEVHGKALAEYKTLMTEENLGGFPGNREQLAPKAKAIGEQFNQAAEHLKTAAAKFEEAAKQGAEEHASAYWDVKAKELRKTAEAKEALRDLTLALVDPAVSDAAKLDARVGELAEKSKKAQTEADEFTKQVDKIKAEYPDVIK
jgi:hypothetical protein